MSGPSALAAVQAVHDQNSFVRFLREELSWPVQDNLTFDDLTYGWSPQDIGVRPEDLRGSTLSQLRPFVNDQPWGIFFVHLSSPKIYLTELTKVIRAFAPKRRKLQDHPTWNPQHLLFICTPDWKNFTFAHFEGEDPGKAKLSTFGWEYQSPFVRTLCEFNIPQLRYPEGHDMFGLGPEAWIKQWSTAFDVKKVTDKFYEEYDKVFREMKKILAPKFKVAPRLYEKRYEDWTHKERKLEQPLHLFVQNLVNRLMFLKFLEKRRWLDFNPNYLRDLYNQALSEKRNFYKDFLFYVFFAGLNRQVPLIVLNGEKVAYQAQMFQERIGILPFLNGGLFEKEPIDEEIEIPNETFSGLFDLFSRYNFTVNEDTPLDVEVAVNPEMLGKVFEESVIARKEKGAYYTPRNIVSFMCREALKNHLSQGKIQNVKVKSEKLVDERTAEGLEPADAIEIYKALHNIKVLDPAVGSGAFPVNMMLELIQIYKTIGEKLEHDHPYLIQNKLANPKDVYNLKKQIIQNSLYGVDIEEFAINIARLRFWLSLAVDFPIDFATPEEFIQRVHEIEPLPNLLYKLRCGDSLLAHYRGVSLEPHGRLASGEYSRGRRNRIKDAIGDVAQMKREFYGQGDSLKKQEKQRQIESSLRGLVVREIDLEIAAMEGVLGQEVLFELTKEQRLERAQIENETQRLRSVREELSTMNGLPSDFPVIWDVEFGEVMTEGGFDVVIANPPYVRQEEIKHLKEDLKLHYECYTGTSDLYVYFYERGIQLLKPAGTITYISSNKFFRAGYGENLREYLTGKTSLKTIIDFGDLPVFEATTYPCVLIATKNGSQTGALKAVTLNTEEQLQRFEETFRAQAFDLEQQMLGGDGWRLEEPRVHSLLEKIKKAGVSLEEYVAGKIYYGIKTGYNEAFVIDAETKKRLIREDKKSAEVIKPLLRGRDIKRYAIEDAGLYLLFIPWHFPLHERTNIEGASKEAEKEFRKQYPAVYKHLLQYKEKLEQRNEAETGIRYEWYALQRCAATYWKELDKSKIVWGNLGECASFGYDENSAYVSAPACMIPINESYLLSLLNSKLADYFVHQIAAVRRGGYLEYKPMYVSQLPVAKPTAAHRRAIEERVEKILAAKRKNPAADTSQLEREIDEIVYEIYGFTEEERRIVEGNKQ